MQEKEFFSGFGEQYIMRGGLCVHRQSIVCVHLIEIVVILNSIRTNCVKMNSLVSFGLC